LQNSPSSIRKATRQVQPIALDAQFAPHIVPVSRDGHVHAVGSEEPARLVGQQRIDASHKGFRIRAFAAQVPLNHIVGDGKILPILAGGAFDLGLPAEAIPPPELIGADGVAAMLGIAGRTVRRLDDSG